MLNCDQEFIDCCAGNLEAAEWLRQWQAYVHYIDDEVDGDVDNQSRVEHLLEAFAGASELYTHPFFLKHAKALQLVVILITSAYADSVQFEMSKVAWKRNWADHWRHVANEMALAVAYICGGYKHVRRISPELRSICHWQHHDPEGNPE